MGTAARRPGITRSFGRNCFFAATGFAQHARTQRSRPCWPGMV